MDRPAGIMGLAPMRILLTKPGTITPSPLNNPRRPARATSSGYLQVALPASPCFSIRPRVTRFVRMPFGQSTLTLVPVPRISARRSLLNVKTNVFVDEYTGH